jgi:hypothetical protein
MVGTPCGSHLHSRPAHSPADTGSLISARVVALLVTLLVVSLPASAERALPIVPTIGLSVAPQEQLVWSSPNETTPVHLTGKVTVGVARGETAHVTLACAVDTGWPAQLSQTQMTFSTSGSQDFSCDVIVPETTSNMTGSIVISGRVVAAGLQSVAQANALIVVNPFGQNLTGPHVSGNSGGGLLGGVAIPVVIVIIAAVAVVGLVFMHRRRRMRPDGGG